MADDIGKLVDLAAAAWQGEMRRLLAEKIPAVGIGAGAAVLEHLDAHGLPQAALTERMGLSKQAVQQLLDQLENAGLVCREPDPADRRAKRVYATEAGQRARDERQAMALEIDARARETIGKKKFKALKKALRLLIS